MQLETATRVGFTTDEFSRFLEPKTTAHTPRYQTAHVLSLDVWGGLEVGIRSGRAAVLQNRASPVVQSCASSPFRRGVTKCPASPSSPPTSPLADLIQGCER